MQILYRGAESIIFLSVWDGQKVLVKERIEKKYRIEQIDRKIRKYRTRKETRLLTEARKHGVPTPKILYVDEASCKIIMEFIDGKRIKDLLNSADKETVEKICFEIGRMIGKLHAGGIIHGDLTTSNMILKGYEVYFIDFGLGEFSEKAEDQGVDLNLLYEALKSTHFKILDTCWNGILGGYRKEYKDADMVLKKIEEIERRGRYMER